MKKMIDHIKWIFESRRDLTVPELKKRLKEKGLPVSGKKAELIIRLKEADVEERTEFELFVGRVKSDFIWAIIFIAIITLFVTFLIAGNPDPIEGFESGASGIAIDDDNFVYVTQQATFVKYSVIEDDDGTLSLKDEYVSPSLNHDIRHLFIEDKYVYAVTDSGTSSWYTENTFYKIEDSGQEFIVNSSRSSVYENGYGVTGIVVSGDYAYVSVDGDIDIIEMYDISNGFDYIGRIHNRPTNMETNDAISGTTTYHGEGYIKGLATNDENLYALIHSCFKADSNEYAGMGILCKDYIYVWKLDTLMSLAATLDESLISQGISVPIDTSMSMGVFHWYSEISANGDYVYLGDDAWGTGIVVVDFSDYNDPKKVHSYGRNIDQYPSGDADGSGIAANDDFIVVSTAGRPVYLGEEDYLVTDDGVYVGKIDGDGDGMPLGKDAFPDWKYVNSNWELYAFLFLILGLPLLIHDGWAEITSQRIKKDEYKVKAELHIAKLKGKIVELKEKGINTDKLERILEKIELT